MKDFKIGQKVYILRREYIQNILNGVIVKVYPNSNRFKVSFDFNKLFGDSGREHIVTRFQDDNEVFSTYEEAYEEAMKIFDRKLKGVEDSRQEFIKQVNEDKEKAG